MKARCGGIIVIILFIYKHTDPLIDRKVIYHGCSSFTQTYSNMNSTMSTVAFTDMNTTTVFDNSTWNVTTGWPRFQENRPQFTDYMYQDHWLDDEEGDLPTPPDTYYFEDLTTTGRKIVESDDFFEEWMAYMEQNRFAQMLLDETIFSIIFGSTWCLFGLVGFFSNIFIFIMMMTKEEREVSQGVYLASLASVDIVLSFAHMFRGGVLLSVRVNGIESLNGTLTTPAGICATEAIENPLITMHAWIIVALLVDSIVSVCFPVQRQMVCTVAKAVMAVIGLLCMSFAVEAYTMSHLISTSRQNLAEFKGLDYAYKNIKYAFIQHCAHASRSEAGSSAAMIDFSFTYAIPLIFVLLATIGLTIELKKRIDKTRTADTYDEANIVLAKICRINRLTITMVCLFAHFLILHAPKGIWVLLFGDIGPPQYESLNPKLSEKTLMTEPPKLTPTVTTPAVKLMETPGLDTTTNNMSWLNITVGNDTPVDAITEKLTTTSQTTVAMPTTSVWLNYTRNDTNDYNNSTGDMNGTDNYMGTTSQKLVVKTTKMMATVKDDLWGVNTTRIVPIDPTKGLTAYRFCQTLLCLSHTMNLLILIISSMYYRRLFYLVICHRRVHFGADLSRGSSLSREAIAAKLGTPAARPGTRRIVGLKHSSASASFRGPQAKVNFTFNGPPQNLNLNGPSPQKPSTAENNGDATSPTELILKEASIKLSTYADKHII